jgi:hypothetical protein
MLVGIKAHRARARHVLQAGETLYCSLSWDEDAPVPASAEELGLYAEEFEVETGHHLGNFPQACSRTSRWSKRPGESSWRN